jgi:hypothetical protein
MKLTDIRIDGGTQPRAKIDTAAVADYAEEIAGGAIFPPLTVFFDGVDHWLADGFHRWHAHKSLQREEVAVDVRAGTLRDAILFSVGANASHGLRRTNEDKRRAVLTLMNDPEWRRWSNRRIAQQCGVAHTCVASLCREYAVPRDDDSRLFVTKHGVTGEMAIARITNKNRERTKPDPFLHLAFGFLRSPECIGLSPQASKLLLDAMSQLLDVANGALTFSNQWLLERHWSESKTSVRAIDELIAARILVATKVGKRGSLTKYALTMWPIECDTTAIDAGIAAYQINTFSEAAQ